MLSMILKSLIKVLFPVQNCSFFRELCINSELMNLLINLNLKSKWNQYYCTRINEFINKFKSSCLSRFYSDVYSW